ncbi:MAG: hypothetical protein U0234_19500 [Sandaracinus sp.]
MSVRRGSQLVFLALLGACAWACASRPQLTIGSECELSTQCASPYVCRLGHCREECRVNRDCGAALVCLRDMDGLGACELPDVDSCVLTSDCAAGLVCLMGHCSEPCHADVDCPAGAMCVNDMGCRDGAMVECELNTDCVAPLICAPDRLCREQCHTDRDCRDGLVCDRGMSPAVCATARTDAGVDAAVGDAGADDAAIPDGGLDGGTAMLDAGPHDGGVTTGLAPIPLLALGSDHSCATRASDGQLRCWGANSTGQLGDASVMARYVATSVFGSPTGVTMLAAGVGHSCGVTSTGLVCWGDGTSGQLGDGSMGARARPGPVSGSLAPSWLAAGHAHTCAVVAGAVRCWGDNTSGQLGDGSTTLRNVPTATLALPATAVQVEARGDWSCAVLADGRVACWGDDRSGQLGVDIPTTMYSAMPLLIGGLDNVVEVALGSSHGCARRGDGVVLCWGRGSNGQLGDGSTGATVHLVPAPTSAMPAAVELAAAGDHTCARTVAGEVYCWGDNFSGACGQDGFVTPTIRAPARVTGVSGALEIAMGDSHTCARVAAGIVCWGDNPSGQLGDNTTSPHFAPAAVTWL